MTSMIETAQDLSFQERARQEPFAGNVYLVNMLSTASGLLPPWWSPNRDLALRNFWKKSDHLSGAVFTMESKMTAIPMKVVARDTSVRAYVEAAKRTTDALLMAAELGEGWVKFYSKFVEDLITVDNGAFGEIIGSGETSGPILGRPYSVAHLDSSRCVRTGSAEFPVVFHDTDGKMYKLHYSRVMYTSQMTSPIVDMYGVGFSSVSRATNVAQTLMDILTYKMEKLGSRPHREILITKGGLDPADLTTAFKIAEAAGDAQGFSRYSKIVVGGSSTLPEASLEEHALSSLPDGFDEETSIVLGMATIALAFGMDARELFPAMTAGATRADALLQHLKQRGKGPGQILQDTETLFNYKFLPSYLKFEFDFQDDAQDRQVAEIREIRAKRRVEDLSSQAIPIRFLRETMLEDGDITYEQFERMELEDGRLVDGNDVTLLFYSTRPDLKKWLDMDVKDPLDIAGNDIEKMLKTIAEKKQEVGKVLVNATSQTTRLSATQAQSALIALEKKYQSPEVFGTPMNQIPPKPTQPQNAAGNPTFRVDKRVRSQDLTTPASDEGSMPPQNQVLRHTTDDRTHATAS